jgi:hypothetical protein
LKYLWIALSLLGVFVASAADAQSTLPQCPHDVRWTNCQGTRTSSDGEYVGKFDGQGTFTWADNGDKYVGQFRDGTKTGQGTLTWADGSKYVGEFHNGRPNGQGTLTWADGSKYVGGFSDGKFSGQGTMFAPNGTITKSGIWETEPKPP